MLTVLYGLVLCRLLAFEASFYVKLAQYYRYKLFNSVKHTKLINLVPRNILIQVPFTDAEKGKEALNDVLNWLWNCRHNVYLQMIDDSLTDDFLPIKLFGALSIVKRQNRDGAKAGALNYGLSKLPWKIDFDYVVILDSDFRLSPDWLELTEGAFFYDHVGCVQTNWSFRNRDQNIVTEAAAIMLEGHFNIEKLVLQHNHKEISFNGSAGMWKWECLKDCGFWNSSTLSEDTALSQKAYINGWSIRYIDWLSCSSLLPTTRHSLAFQQERWCTGGTQTASGWHKLNTIWFNMYLLRLIFFVLMYCLMWMHPIVLLGLPVCIPYLLTMPYWLVATKKKDHYFKSAYCLLSIGMTVYGYCCRGILRGLFSKDHEFVVTA